MKSILTTAALAITLAAPGAIAAKKETKPKAVSGVYKLDTKASEAKWKGSKTMVKSYHEGTVNVKGGEVEVTDNNIVRGWVELDMTSIVSTDMKGKPKQADLEGHLKSADFFEVEKYPTAKFVITSVKPTANPTAGVHTHDITGDLTLKDQTHSLTVPASVTMQDKTAEATTQFKLDRTVWNVRYASDKFFKGLGDKVISNEIEMSLKLKATK